MSEAKPVAWMDPVSHHIITEAYRQLLEKHPGDIAKNCSVPLYTAPPIPAYEALLRKALEAFDHVAVFLRNGIELGYIRMPDPDLPDPALQLPGKVDAVRADLRAALNATKEHGNG